jgi:hypothetical protein
MALTDLNFWNQVIIAVVYAYIVARWAPGFVFSLLFVILSTLLFSLFPILSNWDQDAQVLQAAIEAADMPQRVRFLFVVIFSYVVWILFKYGVIPSIPQVLVRKYGKVVEGTIVKVHDTGVRVGVGVSDTSVGANLGAHFNRQSSLALEVQYQDPFSSSQKFAKITGVLGNRQDFENLKVCKMKVLKLFPKTGVWISS